MNANTRQAPTMDFTVELNQMLRDGWEVSVDGPSGVQLIGAKKMKTLDKGCLAVGIMTVFFGGVGLLFIALAMLDYWFMTEQPTAFLPRPQSLTPSLGDEQTRVRSYV